MESWKKLLLAAGGAAGAAAVLYYLLREDDASKQLLDPSDADREAGGAAEEITKEQLLLILQEIVKTQGQMKGRIKDVTKELLKDKLTFVQTYKRIKDVQPADPLEKHGLSMMDFDQLLEKHSADHRVRQALSTMSGTPNPNSCASEKVQNITVQTIVDVHSFMLEQLEKVIGEFQAIPDKMSYDIKIVMITAQAIACCKIEQTFGITFEDVESAVLLYYESLARHQEFGAITLALQRAMEKLMGEQR